MSPASRAGAGSDRWTAEIIADRLEEAAQTLRRLPRENVRGYFSTWPPIVRDACAAQASDPVRLGPPAPDAIDRMDACLGWLHLLEADEMRLVWLRAERVRWKAIAHRFGMNRSTLWRHWSCALLKIAAALNGR